MQRVKAEGREPYLPSAWAPLAWPGSLGVVGRGLRSLDQAEGLLAFAEAPLFSLVSHYSERGKM